jgi:hypothetical protein
VEAFRGGSPFDCAVVDEMLPASGRIKTYDLLSLAGQVVLEWLEWPAFRREAERAGANWTAYDTSRLLGAVRLVALLPERQPVTFWLGRDVQGEQSDYALAWHKVQITDRIELRAGVGDWVAAANASLGRRELVCILTPEEPRTLRARRLPPLFAVYPFESKDGQKGSIAFAREALLLDTLLYYRKPQVGGTAFIL